MDHYWHPPANVEGTVRLSTRLSQRGGLEEIEVVEATAGRKAVRAARRAVKRAASSFRPWPVEDAPAGDREVTWTFVHGTALTERGARIHATTTTEPGAETEVDAGASAGAGSSTDARDGADPDAGG